MHVAHYLLQVEAPSAAQTREVSSSQPIPAAESSILQGQISGLAAEKAAAEAQLMQLRCRQDELEGDVAALQRQLSQVQEAEREASEKLEAAEGARKMLEVRSFTPSVRVKTVMCFH